MQNKLTRLVLFWFGTFMATAIICCGFLFLTTDILIEDYRRLAERGLRSYFLSTAASGHTGNMPSSKECSRMKNKLALALGCLWLLSCNQSSDPANMPNSPTSGVVKVYCEEGFMLPMKNQAHTFEQIYHNSRVQVEYLNESEVMQGLFNDCCKVMVLSRQLSEKELKNFASKNLYPKQTCIAKSALAFIVPVNSPDTVFSLDRIKQLLSGADTSYHVIFDNENSGATRYLKDTLLSGKPFGRNCFAVSSSLDLVQKLEGRSKTIGVIDYAWISDLDDEVSKELLKKVRPLAIARTENDRGFFPDQSNIETRDYPLCRYMYIARRSEDFSLGTGLIAFVAGPKAQLMFLKQGLVPAFRQERVIEANTGQEEK
jgi:phosphate transport system substrate-binding protein